MYFYAKVNGKMPHVVPLSAILDNICTGGEGRVDKILK